MVNVPHHDDANSVRYGLRACWYSKLENGDAYQHDVTFPFVHPKGTVQLSVFMSPKRWTFGFFYLKEVFTMTQEEMLAEVVQRVRNDIDFMLAREESMMKAFVATCEAVKAEEKPSDDAAQLAAGLAAAGAVIIEAYTDDGL